MKRSEVYIKNLSKNFNIPEDIAAHIYNEINRYDWTVFCSYMGDYDHPEERTAAENKLAKTREALAEEYREIFDNIQKFMSNDREYNIHKMDKEVE